MEGRVQKLIKDSVDKIKLDIRQLAQDHKTTKSYVEQKTCTAMEHLAILGGTVHETLENMVKVLDKVPQELREALQDLAERPDGGDLESALKSIQSQQSRWADIANLVEGLIPKAKQVVTAAEASTPPPQDPIAPPSEVTRPMQIASADASPPAASVVRPSEMVSAKSAKEDKVDVEMQDVEAEGGVDGVTLGREENGEDGSTGPSPAQSPAGEATPENIEDSPASPPAETSNAKRKLDQDADDAPIEKKKKKAPPPKKKAAARRKGRSRSKVADAELSPAEEDMDAEGEPGEA